MTEPTALPPHQHSRNSGIFAPLYTADQMRRLRLGGEPLAGFMRQFVEARETMRRLYEQFPECFDADGRPIVAELRLPTSPPPAAP